MTWLSVTEAHLAKAKRDQATQPHPLNRRAVRYWRFQVFRARYHTAIAIFIGWAIGMLISMLVISLLPSVTGA